MLFVYSYTPDIERLRASLQTLSRLCPDVCGRVVRIGERYYLSCSPSFRIDLSVSQVRSSIPRFGPWLPLEDQTERYGASIANKVVNLDEPLCRIQLTIFDSGHSILAMKLCHVLCDAGGRALLLANLAALYQERHPLPPLDRDRCKLIVPEYEATLADREVADLLSPDRDQLPPSWEDSGEYKIMTISQDSVERLEHQYLGSQDPTFVSTQDLIAAKIWCDIAKSCHFRNSTLWKIEDFRRNTDTGIDRSYLGNAIVFVPIDHNFEDGIVSVRKVAAKIRACSDKLVSRDNIRRESLYDPTKSPDPARPEGGHIVLNNFSKFPVNKFDFGQGPPYWVGGLARPARNVCVFPVTQSGSSKYYLHLNMPGAEMARFLADTAADEFYGGKL